MTILTIISILALWPTLSISDPSLNVRDDINYPFFRGEGSRGIAGGKDYPTDWNGAEGKNVRWKLALPLPGKSSPVIWGDKLFLTGAGNNAMEVYCIDKNTGELLWTQSGNDFPGASVVEPETDVEAGMAVPTPAVTENLVCAAFGNGNIVCYDHYGKLVWGRNIGVPESVYGFTSSLLIYDSILIVQYDSQNKIAISGYDLKTGEQKWETIRSGKMVNSSPVLAFFEDRMQIIVNGNPNVTSFDPATGTELWSLPGVTGDVASSVALNENLIFTAADYFNLLAIKPGKNGGLIWQDNTYTPDVSSPVAYGKYLFVTTGVGDMVCYDAEKGDTLWTHYFGDSFYSSPIICDGKVWALDRSGVMHIVNAGGKLEITGEAPAGERADCTPAFSEKKIYVRGMTHLFCFSR